MKLLVVKTLLMVQDMDRAVKFYTETFALEAKVVSEYWSELAFGNAIVALHGGHDGSENRVSLSFQVDDLTLAMARLIELGAKEVVAPHQREGEPILYAEIADPEGNIVMVTQYVGEA